MMRVLLKEHDTILKSFWAQKLRTKSGGDVKRIKITHGLMRRNKD